MRNMLLLATAIIPTFLSSTVSANNNGIGGSFFGSFTADGVIGSILGNVLHPAAPPAPPVPPPAVMYQPPRMVEQQPAPPIYNPPRPTQSYIPILHKAEWTGPSYPCVESLHEPVARYICSDPNLAKAEIELTQAYYALAGQMGGYVPEIKAESNLFWGDLRQRCVLLANPKDCILSGLVQQHNRWLFKTSGVYHEEAKRPIESHVELQRRLQIMGLLPATEQIDGVYGKVTRMAITEWQQRSDQPVTGAISDSDAALIMKSATSPPVVAQPRPPATPFLPPSITAQPLPPIQETQTSPAAKPAVVTTVTRVPLEIESELIQIADAARHQPTSDTLRRTRAEAICRLLNADLSIVNWVGTVESVSVDKDEGKAMISISIAPNVVVKTWTNPLSDLRDQTMLDIKIPAFRKVPLLHPHDRVKFSGRFFVSERDCIKDAQMVLGNTMQSPEFIVKFDAIDIGNGA